MRPIKGTKIEGKLRSVIEWVLQFEFHIRISIFQFLCFFTFLVYNYFDFFDSIGFFSLDSGITLFFFFIFETLDFSSPIFSTSRTFFKKEIN